MKKLLVAALAAFAVLASTAQAVVTNRQPGLYFEEINQSPAVDISPGELHQFLRIQVTAVGDTHYIPYIYVGAYSDGGGVGVVDEIVILDEDTMKVVGRKRINQEGKGMVAEQVVIHNLWEVIELSGEFIHAEQTRTFLICANINWNVYDLAPAEVQFYLSGFSHWSYSGQNEEFGPRPISPQCQITGDPYWVGYVNKNFGADLGLGGTLPTGRRGKVASWGFVFPSEHTYEVEFIPFIVNVGALPPKFKYGSLILQLRGGNKLVAKSVTIYVFPGMKNISGQFKVGDATGFGLKDSLTLNRGTNFSVEMTAGSGLKGSVVNVELDEKNLILYEKSSNRILQLPSSNNNFGPPVLIGPSQKGYSVIPAVK